MKQPIRLLKLNKQKLHGNSYRNRRKCYDEAAKELPKNYKEAENAKSFQSSTLSAKSVLNIQKRHRDRK